MSRVAAAARAVLAAALGVLLPLSAGATAEAHATYVRSNPAADARLVRPPTEVRVVFSEPPAPSGSDIHVSDASGRRVDKGDVVPSGEENGLKVSLEPIGDGGYTVVWTALSAVDGHSYRGTFVFAVGNAPLPGVPEVAEPSPPPSVLEVAGRALSYAGIAISLGLAIFGFVVYAARDAGERRRERIAFLFGGALLVAGAGLQLLQQGTGVPPWLGLLLGIRALAGVTIVAAVRIAPRVLAFIPRRDVIYAAGLAATLTATLVSHAAATGSYKDILLDLAHIVSVSAWLGGIVGILVVVLPGAHPRTADDGRRLGRIVWRFSLLALVAVAVIITTGTLQSLDRLVLVQDLVETPYGIALLSKILLLALVLAIGALNLFIWGPRLGAGLRVESARRGLLRGTLGESALLALVLVAAGLLTAFAPPNQRTAAAYDDTEHVGGLRLQLLVPTTLPGRNRYVLRIHDGLRPVEGAEKVAFRFRMVEHDMGESELVAHERAPGEYVAEGSPTAMFGTWHVEAIIRRPGREDVSAIFTFPVSAPSSGGSVARAIPAGPYTAVVFVEPTLPEAGAPLTVTVLVIDAKGDPVPNKPVSAVLRSSEPRHDHPDILISTEIAPGRYRFDIPSLEPGKWTIAVSIGDEGKAEYAFEVAP
ncbi:MAG: copper resistance protein CopC [Chloroflexota bacterium]|nr:copper resistance protein CopC [Chloroflexota bacterium]